eukprot:g3436.t1
MTAPPLPTAAPRPTLQFRCRTPPPTNVGPVPKPAPVPNLLPTTPPRSMLLEEDEDVAYTAPPTCCGTAAMPRGGPRDAEDVDPAPGMLSGVPAVMPTAGGAEVFEYCLVAVAK